MQVYAWMEFQLLDLWNLFIEAFHCDQNQPSKTKDSSAQWHRVMSSTRKKNQTKAPTKHDISELFHIDNVPSNVKLSQSTVMLYVFEDNEAAIKLIIKGRSPTMRHVSRTHRVSLDWLFDRINLDPKIESRYIDTKHQIADMLAKGTFTRDEWNNLLHLFNISNFSSLCCAKNFSLISCTERMANRMQRTIRRRQDCGRIQADGDEPDQFCCYKFFICEQSDCVEKPGDTQASSRQVGLSGRPDASTYQNSNPDAESSSQGWQGDAQLCISTEGLLAIDKDQKSLNRQEESVISTGRLVATEYQGCSGNLEVPEDSEPKSRI